MSPEEIQEMIAQVDFHRAHTFHQVVTLGELRAYLKNVPDDAVIRTGGASVDGVRVRHLSGDNVIYCREDGRYSVELFAPERQAADKETS